MFGKWRSPVAHLYGVQGVAGSNPVFPTMPAVAFAIAGFFIYYESQVHPEHSGLSSRQCPQLHSQSRAFLFLASLRFTPNLRGCLPENARHCESHCGLLYLSKRSRKVPASGRGAAPSRKRIRVIDVHPIRVIRGSLIREIRVNRSRVIRVIAIP